LDPAEVVDWSKIT